MLNFYKNIAFTRLVKSADRLREFNFRRLITSADELFHVDVSDDRGNRIIFKMHKDNSGFWKVTDPSVPAWISSIEDKLHEAIQDELQKQSVA